MKLLKRAFGYYSPVEAEKYFLALRKSFTVMLKNFGRIPPLV